MDVPLIRSGEKNTLFLPIMLIPAVIITFIIQKNLVRGLTFGAVKG